MRLTLHGVPINVTVQSVHGPFAWVGRLISRQNSVKPVAFAKTKNGVSAHARGLKLSAQLAPLLRVVSLGKWGSLVASPMNNVQQIASKPFANIANGMLMKYAKEMLLSIAKNALIVPSPRV